MPQAPLIDRPIFIVSTPRSGSTLLFETLARAPGLFTTGNESHRRIEGIADLSPRARGWSSNRLQAEDASPAVVEQLSAGFYADLADRDGRAPHGPARLLEKTPKNALRVPFFDAAFPDASFVYLRRDVRETLASMIEAWLSGRFRTYPDLPGWTGPPWSLLLVPGWRELIGERLPEIVAAQWAATTHLLLADLQKLPPERVFAVEYADLIARPQQLMPALSASLALDWDSPVEGPLPYSKTTLSRPAPDKWRDYEDVIERVWPLVEQADAAARAFVQSARRVAPSAGP